MQKIIPHLYDRAGHLYYRQSLPPHFKSLFGRNEILASLRTRNLAEGKLICAQLDLHYINLSQAYAEALPSIQREMMLRNYQEAITPYLSLSKGNQREKPRNGPRRALVLSKAYPDYINQRRADGLKALQAKKSSYLRIIEVIGDMPITMIGKSQAKQFIEHLTQTNPKLAVTTVNGHISNLYGLFQWLGSIGEYAEPNPFFGLKFKENKDQRKKRDIYQTEDLTILFGSPIYTGCAGKNWSHRFLHGGQIHKDSLYWVPLIGFYSGMRINEICQLHLADIKIDHEYPYFDLNENNGNRLKTASSRRKVPIHNALIKLGLIDHVRVLKEQDAQRLFPELKPGPYGNYGFYFSRTFAQVLRRLGLKRPGLCFHSFRHTFVDNCKEAGIERPVAMALCGHDSGRSAHDFYGSGYSIRTLSNEINRIHILK